MSIGVRTTLNGKISATNNVCLKISFHQKTLADFKMGSPKMADLYSSVPDNGHNDI